MVTTIEQQKKQIDNNDIHSLSHLVSQSLSQSVSQSLSQSVTHTELDSSYTEECNDSEVLLNTVAHCPVRFVGDR